MKQIWIFKFFLKFFHQSLLELDSFDFRVPYAYYNVKGTIEENHRVKVAKAVVYSILEKDPERKWVNLKLFKTNFNLFFLFRLSKQDFIHLANTIVEVFPTEAAGTYYVPSEKSKNPTGKLLSSYSNIRHTLASVGIIARDSRQSQGSVATTQVEVSIEVLEAVEVIQSETFEDKDLLVQCWQITHEKRQEDIKSQSISTSEYMGRYPYLREINGYELVLFSFLSPIKKIIIFI